MSDFKTPFDALHKAEDHAERKSKIARASVALAAVAVSAAAGWAANEFAKANDFVETSVKPTFDQSTTCVGDIKTGDVLKLDGRFSLQDVSNASFSPKTLNVGEEMDMDGSCIYTGPDGALYIVDGVSVQEPTLG